MKVLKNTVTGNYSVILKQVLPGTFDPVVVFRDCGKQETSRYYGDTAAERLVAAYSLLFGCHDGISFEFTGVSGENLFADWELKRVATGEKTDIAVTRFIARTYELAEIQGTETSRK